MRRPVLAAALLVAALWAPQAHATIGVKYGIQDDNYILNGPGKLATRLDTIDKLGVDMVRFTIKWDEVERRQGRFNWGRTDQVLRGLNNRRVQLVVTLVGTPGWANGGRAPRFAPPSGKDFAKFAGEAAKRYPFVRHWLIWNEPNMRRWLEPTVPGTYVRRLLNPAYKAIHQANRRAKVGGGVTGPRANAGGMSPLEWLRGMRKAGARLDAYAHHPHPASAYETPTEGGCFGARCKTVTLANLKVLVDAVRRAWGGGKRIWLTEWGYQTNPPDRFLGVSPRLQAQYIGEAARLVYRTRQIDMLIQFLYQDEPQTDRFQSGLLNSRGRAKPGLYAFTFPLAASADGTVARLWGQIRPRAGRQPYRIQLWTRRSKQWLTPVRSTNLRGIFATSVRVPIGAVIRVYSVRDRRFGAPVTVE